MMKKYGMGVEGVLLAAFGAIAATYSGNMLWHYYTLLGAGMALDYLIKNKDLPNLFRGAGLTRRIEETELIPLVVEKRKRDYGEDLLLTIPPGLSTTDFENHREAIENGLGASIEFQYINAGLILMRVYKVPLKSKYDYEPIKLGNTEIPIGYSHKGLITLKFDDQYSNLLVGGVPGSGKSVFLRQAIVNLMLHSSAKFHLIDLKNGVEFAIFKRCQCVESFASNESEARVTVQKLKRIMLKRYKAMERAGVVKASQFPNKMEPIFIIVDEYANLREYKDIQESFDRLLRMSRAANMFFIICTQRPSSETVPGVIKANIQATLAFRCRNEINSRILLDDGTAANLSTAGRGIFQTDKNYMIQVPFISDSKAKELIKSKYTPELPPNINMSGVVKVVDGSRRTDYRDYK
jgi:S-DNA-T family DNA segregation ATPase FtsK/SpoIIIE